MSNDYAAAVRKLLAQVDVDILVEYHNSLGAHLSGATPENLDTLTAFAITESDDPATSWNLASSLSEAGHNLAAAAWFLISARTCRESTDRRDTSMDDEEDWALAAESNAVRELVSAGALLSAAVLTHSLPAEERGEAVGMVDSQLETPA